MMLKSNKRKENNNKRVEQPETRETHLERATKCALRREGGIGDSAGPEMTYRGRGEKAVRRKNTNVCDAEVSKG